VREGTVAPQAWPVEELAAGVRPAFARSDEQVVATEAVPQPIEDTEGVAVPVDPIVGIQHQRTPTAGDHGARRVRQIRFALALDLAEERQRFEDRTASWGPVEGHRAEQRR
jgi:hypothetical protein